jgi:general secretion pathway protein M
MTPLLLRTPLVRRLAFLAGNGLVVLVIAYGCFLHIGELLAERDREILHKQAVLARLQAAARREVQPTGKKTSIEDGEFLAGKTDGAIGAELQARLKGIAEAAGAKVRSIRGLPPKTDGRSRYVGSHIEVLGSVAAIQRAIHAVETAKPYLFITSGTMRLAPPVGPVGTPHEPLIEAQLDIFGAMRVEAREP